MHIYKVEWWFMGASRREVWVVFYNGHKTSVLWDEKRFGGCMYNNVNVPNTTELYT